MIKNLLKNLFKKISYSFFLKFHGVISESIKSTDDSRILEKTEKKNKNLIYKVYIILNGRLYTDRIQDISIILDNKIIEEASIQLRFRGDNNIINSNINDNIVFTKGTPRKLKKLKGTVLSLLTGGAGNRNYWHWLFDVLPRLELCKNFIKLNDIDFFLLPDQTQQFQIDTLNLLNIPLNKRISSKNFRHIKAKKLIVTEHPVMISGNATKDIENIPSWISEWLKITFLNNSVTSNKKIKNKIYIDRSEKNITQKPQRIISNEKEIKKYLIKNNFIIIKLHEINFKEQVDLFYNADCVVGLHGGGFSNIVFCKPGTKIIELKNLVPANAIKNLAIQNNLNYKKIEIKAEQIYEFEFPNQQGSIEVPVTKLSELIESK